MIESEISIQYSALPSRDYFFVPIVSYYISLWNSLGDSVIKVETWTTYQISFLRHKQVLAVLFECSFPRNISQVLKGYPYKTNQEI